jgi:hypothetical protein
MSFSGVIALFLLYLFMLLSAYLDQPSEGVLGSIKSCLRVYQYHEE